MSMLEAYRLGIIQLKIIILRAFSGELKLLEAEAAKWLTKEELDSVQWLPADVTLIDKIKSCMS